MQGIPVGEQDDSHEDEGQSTDADDDGHQSEIILLLFNRQGSIPDFFYKS